MIMVGLKDLPQFTITAISSTDGETTQLKGTFNTLTGVSLDSWDYLYRYGVRSWLPAQVVSYDQPAKTMIYSVYNQHLAPFHAKTGDLLAWINSAWSPEYVEAILDPEKKWMSRVGSADIRAQCELCMICYAHIEVGAPYWWSESYEFTRDFFTCTKCYNKYVVAKDLSFIL